MILPDWFLAVSDGQARVRNRERERLHDGDERECAGQEQGGEHEQRPHPVDADPRLLGEVFAHPPISWRLRIRVSLRFGEGGSAARR